MCAGLNENVFKKKYTTNVHTVSHEHTYIHTHTHMHWYTFRGSKNKNTPELIARAQQLNTSNRYLKCIYTHTNTWVPSILSRSQHLNSEYLKDAVFKYYIYQVSTAKYYWKYVWAGIVSHIAIDRCGWPGESVVYVLIRTCFLAAQMQQIFSCIFMLHNIETIYTLYDLRIG